MPKQVLFDTQTVGDPFVVLKRRGSSMAFFVKGRGTNETNIQQMVDGDWYEIRDNSGADWYRASNIGQGLPTRMRLETATAGPEVFVSLENADDRNISVAPRTTTAARTLAQETGDVDTVYVFNDFTIDDFEDPRISFAVASADESVATAAVTQEGNVTITAVAAGSSVVTVTITDRWGRTATQTITTTVTAP